MQSSSREHLTDSLLCDVLTMDGLPRTRSFSDTKRQGKRNIFYTNKIMKLFVCLFYGIIPCLFAVHERKLYSLPLPLCLLLLQWYAVVGYIYCTDMFWVGSKKITANATMMELQALPQIPLETLLLLLGLAVSGAITVTMAVYYFYSRKNKFSTNEKGDFNLIPIIDLDETDDADNINKFTQLTEKEWLLTNCLFLFGIVNVIFVLASDFGTDTLFDFHGIRAFLDRTTPSNRAIYIVAVSMLFWGFGGTVCACCIFHVMSRRLIMCIKKTQSLIMDKAISRQDFFTLHERLLIYTEKMIDKFKYWFAIHNFMFIFLVAAMIFEWVTFMKSTKYEHNYMLSQISGTMLICYKFAFPFFTASRVTVRFTKFYLEMVRSNKFENIPEMLLLQGHFGFTIFGLRITPSVAIVVFLSSFVGILKFISAELQL